MSEQSKKKALKEDMQLLEKVRRSEEQIINGRFVKAVITIKDEEIDDLLIG